MGDKAVITQGDIAELQTLDARIARLDAFMPPLADWYKVLVEARALLADEREKLISNAAQSVDQRAKHEPGLLAKYEKTRAYRSAASLKAVKTRREKAPSKPKEQAAGAVVKADPPKGQPVSG